MKKEERYTIDYMKKKTIIMILFFLFAVGLGILWSSIIRNVLNGMVIECFSVCHQYSNRIGTNY